MSSPRALLSLADGPLDMPDACKSTNGGVIFSGIRKLELHPNGTCASVNTVAGLLPDASSPNRSVGFADGPVDTAQFHYVHGVRMQPAAAAGAGGTASRSGGPASSVLFAIDDNNNRVRKVDLRTGQVTTLAGSGDMGCKDGAGVDATFQAVGLAVGHDSSLYVADYSNHRIRKLTIS